MNAPWCTLVAVPVLLGLAACGSDPVEVPSPGPRNYRGMRPRAVSAVSSSEVYVAGSLIRRNGTPEGLILRSEDGGRTWQRTGFEFHDMQRVAFHSLHFTDRLRGWVGGVRVDDAGRTLPIVLRTVDGGNHWREASVPMDPGVIVTEVRGVRFSSDEKGALAINLLDPASGKLRQSVYATDDAGRSWHIVEDLYRGPPGKSDVDPGLSFIDKKTGFRLRPGTGEETTFVEVTGSGGRDWLPVHELSLAGLPGYY